MIFTYIICKRKSNHEIGIMKINEKDLLVIIYYCKVNIKILVQMQIHSY